MTSQVEYKVHINDRSYQEWTFYTVADFQKVELSIIPTDHKLFTNDIFTFNADINSSSIIHSNIRNHNAIPCVLILKNNKTYGRSTTGANKLLYKCIPDDTSLPTFLVPYEIKNVGFSKVFENLYVIIQFKEWLNKHPVGALLEVIGPVDVLANFYEYQLYCKNLNISIQKFNKETIASIKKYCHHDYSSAICANYKYSNIEDRCHIPVFTIDPDTCTDFDDAFSIEIIDNNITMLSIYISNVTILIDNLDLWDAFSKRVSTIYLPDKKRPMLPNILSDGMCSLKAGEIRIAFVMDVFINGDGEIIEIKHSNCKINVTKNYCYEEPILLTNNLYIDLFYITKKLSHKYRYMKNIKDSHDVVAYLMILMNYYTAKELLKNGNGLFRSTILNNAVHIPEDMELPEEVSNFMKIWNSSAGQYIDASKLKEDQTLSHDLLEMDAYVHITSPIRRLPDLLNILQFQQNTGIIKLSENADKFLQKWLSKVDYINTTMRSIRRVQNDCSLLHLCSTNTEVMNKEYDGYAFDKIVRSDGLFQFNVYLPELRLTTKLILRDNLEQNIENYKKSTYKLFVFNNEEKFKKKIRLQLVV